jgi:hypothetical protein
VEFTSTEIRVFGSAFERRRRGGVGFELKRFGQF